VTDKYPLLTVESVKYWYWECDPAYSVNDINKVTGAPTTTIIKFMNKNGISKRTMSEANFNRYKCAHKREAFIEQRNSLEFKKNQSRISASLWQDDSIRKKIVNGIKKFNESILGEVQIKVLFALSNFKGMFFTDLKTIITNNKNCVNDALRKLCNRGLLTRVKKVNPNTNRTITSQYYYSVNDKGIKLLAQKEKDPRFYSLFDSLKDSNTRNIIEQNKNSISTYLGKNQKEILRWFQDRNSLFLMDLKKLTSIDEKILDRSLKGLFTRGILSRKKETKPNSLNNNRYFRYYLTELGKKIKIS